MNSENSKIILFFLGIQNRYSDIQNYFEYIIKKHETVTDKPPIRTYVNVFSLLLMNFYKNF